MSSDRDPTWSVCRRAVWLFIQNFSRLADAEDLLSRQEDDLHIASGKCFILLLTAVRTLEKSHVECALAEFKRLEARCVAKTSDGWIKAMTRKLFTASAASVHDYDRQIALADATTCIVGLTMASHMDHPSVATMSRAMYALRRAWKMYQQCYSAVLEVYRNEYDLEDQNIPRWPPVLKRRQSDASASASNIGSRMLRSATTSFEMLRQNRFASVSNMMPKDVVRLMAAVSLGYGAFNLMVSLLPPTIVSIIGMFGFRGNRQTGLDALSFAKNGPGVHAPLAWSILSWYLMIGNTDFMFDCPQSREKESYINEAEQLASNPPEEFKNTISLQYFIGRSCYLKGDLDGSIRAYETGSTTVDYGLVNMKAMHLHELGFMYVIKLDWTTACKKFANVAGDNIWLRPFHYFMATVCAGAAGDTSTAELMVRRVNDTINENRWMQNAERNMVGSFVVDCWLGVENALRTADAGDAGRRHCRLTAYEAAYVKYGVAGWPVDALHAVLADCQENYDDADTTKCMKKFLTIMCQKALGVGLWVHDNQGDVICLTELVKAMEQEKRRDHLYAYGLYELAVEQIDRDKAIDEGKRTIQKLNDLEGPYHFQYFYRMRCASLQAYVQNLNVR